MITKLSRYRSIAMFTLTSLLVALFPTSIPVVQADNEHRIYGEVRWAVGDYAGQGVDDVTVEAQTFDPYLAHWVTVASDVSHTYADPDLGIYVAGKYQMFVPDGFDGRLKITSAVAPLYMEDPGMTTIIDDLDQNYHHNFYVYIGRRPITINAYDQHGTNIGWAWGNIYVHTGNPEDPYDETQHENMDITGGSITIELGVEKTYKILAWADGCTSNNLEGWPFGTFVPYVEREFSISKSSDPAPVNLFFRCEYSGGW